VVVLQIEVADFTLPDVKGQPPIAAHRNAPRSGAVAALQHISQKQFLDAEVLLGDGVIFSKKLPAATS
jgi:hypothetical protein